MDSVKAECGPCGGTGIYSGIAEPVGVGVVCLRCRGSGGHSIEYTPFTGRKRRTDIQEVRLPKGFSILHCGPGIGSVEYADFLAGIMPEDPT